MTDYTRLGAAVVGTGFIGTVHAGALRRLGVAVHGVVGSSAERAAERAPAMGVASAYASFEAMLADPAVDVVHVTSPNHAHYAQVLAILEAGKHVVCEKPLAMTAAEAAEMARVADASGRVAAVCYNIRFYPLNQHAARMVAEGKLGASRFVTGHYHQDWLSRADDWNWRVDPAEGGALRAVGDIGTHFVDLTSFILGEKPSELLAELTTFLPQRQKPVGPVETFTAASGTTEGVAIETDDAAQILLRYPSGARGTMTVSQVSPGRKNSLVWDIAGATRSAAWDSETPDHLWIGNRAEANRILQRDASLMNADGAAAAYLPGGHVEGFADTFFALFAQVYADVAAGGRRPASTWATFADGHYEMEFCEAVLRSAREGRWAKVAS
ncbi:MAG: Gfo/Idh/MocA family oxidoreductase [Acuticoccus sp.]